MTVDGGDESFAVREDRSNDINESVDEALKRVLAENGCMYTGHVGIVNFITPTGAHGWCMLEDPDQQHITQRAMILFLSEYNEEITRINIREMIRGEFDGE